MATHAADRLHSRAGSANFARACKPARTRSRNLFGWRNYFSFGFAILYLFVASIIAMAVHPPLLNVNRFKRRIVTSISTSIGRPVHLDSVTLVHVCRFPGFKLENFVVAEDPAFGCRARHPRQRGPVATLRIQSRSMAARRSSFRASAFTEPSINLVHIPSEGSQEGSWNVEEHSSQSSSGSPAAPTAQTYRPAPTRAFRTSRRRVPASTSSMAFGKAAFLADRSRSLALWLPASAANGACAYRGQTHAYRYQRPPTPAPSPSKARSAALSDSTSSRLSSRGRVEECPPRRRQPRPAPATMWESARRT